MKTIESKNQLSLWLFGIVGGLAIVLTLPMLLVETLWIRMWLLAGGLYFGLKTLILVRAGEPVSSDAVIWFLFCPTLNLTAFLRRRDGSRSAVVSLTFAGLVNLAFGIVLLWVVARQFVGVPLVAGWTGMTGLIFMMHFGVAHLVTAFWMQKGRGIEPLMKCPVAASSLADFWGRRWNTAFPDAMTPLLFRPVAACWNARGAHWLVFLISGLLHETVISLPAGGGWGGPTLYFLLQACGMELSRRLRIPAGIASRVWTFAFLILPVGLLFHPPFVLRVMLPFFQTIGALS
ncbi:MAG: MBOAT family protein [Prosthecobacter sp.]